MRKPIKLARSREELALLTVTTDQVLADLDRLLAQVARGEHIVITQLGAPVAELSPVTVGTADDERQRRIVAAIEGLRQLRGRTKPFDAPLRRLIEEQRPS